MTGLKVLGQRCGGIDHAATPHVIEGDPTFLDTGPKGTPLRRLQIDLEACGLEHGNNRLADLLVRDVAANRGVKINLDAVGVARLLQQLARLGGVVAVAGLQIRRVAILSWTNRSIETARLSIQHDLDQRVPVDRMGDGLPRLLLVPWLEFGAHRQEHEFHRILPDEMGA